MSDIKFIVKSSIEKRNVFHSERDFQLALGLCLMKKFGDNVRLEYPLTRVNNKNEYCDIVCAGFSRVGIELKYKTASLSESINGEDYHLKHQGAQDCGRYDFLRDVLRLEQWIASGKIDVGYAVLLTNDKSYWLPEKEGSTASDLAFRLSDGRVVNGELCWSNFNSKANPQRASPIALAGEYSLNWLDTGRDDFKLLIVKVQSNPSHV